MLCFLPAVLQGPCQLFTFLLLFLQLLISCPYFLLAVGKLLLDRSQDISAGFQLHMQFLFIEIKQEVLSTSNATKHTRGERKSLHIKQINQVLQSISLSILMSQIFKSLKIWVFLKETLKTSTET